MISKSIAGCCVAILLLSHGLAQAQTPNAFGATLSEPNAKTADISTDEMRLVLKNGSALVIDSRTKAEFDAGHIPGAKLLEGFGVTAVQAMSGGDKARPIVLYCNGPYCQASRRLGEELAGAGFTNVKRYQLGIPVWRAFGGPTALEASGLKRIYNIDRTAVLIDVRGSDAFQKGSLESAHNVPAVEYKAGKAKLPLPEDDFNRRVVILGETAEQAEEVAESLKERPWHNVMYLNSDIGTSIEALR